MKEWDYLNFAEAQEELKREFPELQNIPEEAIYIEVTRRKRKFEGALKEIEQPYDIDNLLSHLEIEKMYGNAQTLDKIEEEQRIFEIADFLEDKKNKKIYEGYLKSVRNTPKTLLIFPLLGFKGYLDKLKELYPEKAIEAEKKMQDELNQALREGIEKLRKIKSE